ncbi:MAG: ribonuclease P protein subunit [Euryarchaeota archaeon]|nr:ribonuclease P protein subunit [Euryarchaeota archaeon]
MNLRAKYITKHELIGLECEVVAASDPTLAGLRGVVVDESRNMLTIEVEGKRKRIPKAIARFRFRVGRHVLEVEGRALLARPEDRIKR